MYLSNSCPAIFRDILDLKMYILTFHLCLLVTTRCWWFQECYCCRESFLKERIITLTHCYDPDGIRLTQEGQASLDVKIREPADCKCFKCGDFSRWFIKWWTELPNNGTACNWQMIHNLSNSGNTMFMISLNW